MNLKEISFEPKAEVEFSASDVNLLMEWSKAHYDAACKQVGQRTGWLYGLSNSAPDYKHTLTWRQLDTLRKICEMGALMQNPLAITMSLQLCGILTKMSENSPDVITFNDTIKEGESAWLLENDCFGTRTMVRVVKIHKGGNAIVVEGEKRRECSVNNLRSVNP